MKKLVILLLVIFLHTVVSGQELPDGTNSGDWNNLKHAWKAWWISHPTAPGNDYGVYHFRKNFQLDNQPDHFIIHVSADNRYRLFINGTPVCEGPARGDFLHWQYETIDIARYLTKGTNTLAALVYNFGSYRPDAQFSRETGFILQGDSENEQLVTTDNSWRVLENRAYFPKPVDGKRVHGFYVAGPCDSLVASNYPWNWEQKNFDDSKWLNPVNSVINRGTGAGYMHGTSRNLVKRTIPLMEEKKEKFLKIIRSEPQKEGVTELLKGQQSIGIAANSHYKLLFDNTKLDVGYPELTFTGGKDATIRIEYAEALFDADGRKGNRNEVAGKTISGACDVIVADGGSNRKFRPLWLRTFRFVQLEITTGNEPLVLNDFNYTSYKYPFEENGSVTFEPELLPFNTIWETGWRTARLCANETYWDCPYYEQLQYIGDTRIQALISLYVSGDDRLMRNAIEQINNSITGEGLTLCRAPSQIQCIIPTFSLIYIGMLNDYLMHRPDTSFLKPLLPNIKVILSWFESRIQQNGLLGPIDWWPFADWSSGFQNGIPAGAEEGNSTLMTLTYAKALQDAAGIYKEFNLLDDAAMCSRNYAKIKAGINNYCFDFSKGIYADTPVKNSYSQHTNVMAVLSGVADEKDQTQLIKRVLNDSSLIQCTLYYKFYLVRTLEKLRMGNYYFDQLRTWKEMIDLGLSTFPENEIRTNWEADSRSDCHAWSASVCYDFLSVICGINPGSPGFKTVEISPSPGNLEHIKGEMPHPGGKITIDLEFKNSGVKGTVVLPPNVKGKFYWKGKEASIVGGLQTINLK